MPCSSGSISTPKKHTEACGSPASPGGLSPGRLTPSSTASGSSTPSSPHSLPPHAGLEPMPSRSPQHDLHAEPQRAERISAQGSLPGVLGQGSMQPPSAQRTCGAAEPPSPLPLAPAGSAEWLQDEIVLPGVVRVPTLAPDAADPTA